MKHVREFHLAFGCPNPSKPTVPSDERLRLRLKLIAEEFIELLQACGADGFDTDDIQNAIDTSLLDLHEGVDMVKVADALADIDYVVEGMRLELGIDGEPIAAEVHRSNCSKIGAERRPDGKILKGPNYSPPDIEGELRKQGWEG